MHGIFEAAPRPDHPSKDRPRPGLQSFHTFTPGTSAQVPPHEMALHSPQEMDAGPINFPIRPRPSSGQLLRPEPHAKASSNAQVRPAGPYTQPPSPQPPQVQPTHLKPPRMTPSPTPPTIQQPQPLAPAQQNGKSSGMGKKVFFGVTKAVVGGVANAAGVGGIEYGISAIQTLANQD